MFPRSLLRSFLPILLLLFALEFTSTGAAKTKSEQKLAPTGGVFAGGPLPENTPVRRKPELKSLSLAAPARVQPGTAIVLRGALKPSRLHARLIVERRAGRRWEALARTESRGGRFKVRLRARRSPLEVRVRPAEQPKPVSPRRAIKIASAGHWAPASWYGPGLYGNLLGCGGRLGPGTLGVAHKTLPCGAQVTLSYHGRQVTVPVVDRGPYAGGREFDLTAATARALGFSGVGSVFASY